MAEIARTARRAKIGEQPGVGIDAYGGKVVDPTANVIALVQSESKRHDELRAADQKRADELRGSDTKRLDDLRAAESRRVDEQANIRAHFQEQLALAEANRINAIRAVDVAAVATASERAGQQAQVLAAQVLQSADTLRGLVATTASAQAATLQTITTTLTDRIASLEKAQYENKGIAGVRDPAIDALISEVRGLAAARAQGQGQGQGANAVIGYIIGGVGLLSTIIAIGFAILKP